MDYPNWYKRISQRFRSEGAAKGVNLLDRGLVYLVAVAYAIVLVVLLATGDARFLRTLIVPAATFALVTVVRRLIDAPRPYDLFPIDPIIVKDTTGKSLPSRHVASAAIIACALMYVNPVLGAFGFLACIVVSFTRIVGGVHFPKDVAAALAIALACGIVGFVIVP